MAVDTLTMQTTIHGREFGLDVAGRGVLNLADGTQERVVSQNPVTGALNSPELQALVSVAGLAPLLGIYVGSWAGRPNAATHPEARAFITDIGLNGCWVISTGVRWRADGPVVLPGMLGGTYAKTDSNADWGVGWSCTLPAGFMGPTGRVVIEPAWTFPSSAPTKNLQIMVNGTFAVFSKSRTTTTGETPLVEIMNRGTTANQVAAYNGAGAYATGSPSVTVATGTINTETADVSFVARAQFPAAAATGETITLHKCNAIFYPG